MTVYIVAQLKFSERARYDRYQARFFDVFRQFNGKLLAADDKPVVLEGDWPRDKIVMMEFPDAASANAFHESPEYQEIAIDRKAGAGRRRADGARPALRAGLRRGLSGRERRLFDRF